MTSYTVLWDEIVEDGLANAWLSLPSGTRKLLTSTANWIDANLSRDPKNGASYDQANDIWIVKVPLEGTDARIAASFTVSDADRLVRVVRITFRVASSSE